MPAPRRGLQDRCRARLPAGRGRGAFVSLLLVALLPLGLLARADDNWISAVDEDGLSVETRKVEGSQFKAFRARIVVPATPTQVLTRLQDVERYPQWFPDTTEAFVVRDGATEWASYARTAVPWPLKDRDSVYTSRLEEDGEVLRILMSSDPDAVEERDDAVRIRQAAGFWELRAVAMGTDVYWEFHAEPGGRVPSSLANARVVETPQKALLALRDYFRALDAGDGAD